MTVITDALSRLAYQFKDSPKLQAFFTAFAQQFQDLDTSSLQLLNERYLNVAIGVQLDGIGEIVGLERPTKPTEYIDYFGFYDDPTSLGFTTLATPSYGGHFVSLEGLREYVDDDEYRLLIRAKIIENQTAMTVEDTLLLTSFIFGGIEVRYFLFYNLQPRYDLGKILTEFDKEVLETLPVLIGLGDIDYRQIYTSTPFSFYEDTSGYGFGTLADSAIGGNFAKFFTA